jgi:hypothetical protein
MDIHPLEILFPGDFAEPCEDVMFDTSTEDTTAQEKTLDIEGVTVGPKNDEAGEAVVAEPVAY